MVLYKLVIEDSKTNLYGESLNKTYYQGVECSAIIQREDTQSNYEGFGADSSQTVQFRFNRFTLEDKGFYPEIGDIIKYDDSYYEIDNMNDTQYVAGQPHNSLSILCDAHLTRISGLNIEEPGANG